MVLQLLPPNFFLPNLRYFLKGESWFKSYKIEEQIVTKMQNNSEIEPDPTGRWTRTIPLCKVRYLLVGCSHSQSWYKSNKIEEPIVTIMQNSNASLVVKSNQIQQIGGQERYHCTKLGTSWWGTAIAPWIRLCLPSCRPEFVSQACHLCFYNLQSNLC